MDYGWGTAGGDARWFLPADQPDAGEDCPALMQLARRVRMCGQKVVLTGKGTDEGLVGYPWYKIAKDVSYLDVILGLRLDDWMRRAYLRFNNVPQFSRAYRESVEDSLGGPNAWVDSSGLLAITKLRFYNEWMREVRDRTHPWAELQLPLGRARRWHPLNRGIWVAGRVVLAAHLLQAKGDRVSMNSSVEARYPFLDEDVFAFTARLHPRWKLHGFRDKHLLRLLAERWLPTFVYLRRKVIFRAPLDSFHVDPEPLSLSGNYSVTNPCAGRTVWTSPPFAIGQRAYRELREGSLPRLSVELGLAAVVTTQLCVSPLHRRVASGSSHTYKWSHAGEHREQKTEHKKGLLISKTKFAAPCAHFPRTS